MTSVLLAHDVIGPRADIGEFRGEERQAECWAHAARALRRQFNFHLLFPVPVPFLTHLYKVHVRSVFYLPWIAFPSATRLLTRKKATEKQSNEEGGSESGKSLAISSF